MRGRLPIGALALVLIVSLAPVALADEFPHLVINTPDHGSTVSGTIDVTGNAWDDVQVLGVKVRIGDGDWLSAQDTSGNDTWWSWSYTWDTTTVPDGWRHIGVIAWDSSNQHTDASIEGTASFTASSAPGYATWPLRPGVYEVRLLLDDGYRSVASSARFKIVQG